MHTLLTPSPDVAATFIQRGKLAAFPTETVYGLGADAFNADAVRRIFEAKGRPSDNPLITHIARRDQVAALARHVPPAAQTLMDRFFPGPLTLILPRHPDVPAVVSAGLDTIGVRMPDHALGQAFLAACGTPVAAPSANRSGRPSPTTWQAVHDDLGGRISCILQGGRTDAGLESTVVDCTEAAPAILRPGAVSREQLQAALPAVAIAVPTAETAARSPGTKHRHYAPRARVHLVDDPGAFDPAPDHAYIGLTPPAEPEQLGAVLVPDDLAAYAHELFHFFRTCDAAGCAHIYCQAVEMTGLGQALMDRLQRAAER